MNYQVLGRTGWKVSEISFGAWAIGGEWGPVDDAESLAALRRAVELGVNGLTFCTGSLGARSDNNVAHMAAALAHRITFAHLRNVTRTDTRDFLEDDHLEGDVDMWAVMRALVTEQRRRGHGRRTDCRMPFRPDHGHRMIPDLGTPRIYPGIPLSAG